MYFDHSGNIGIGTRSPSGGILHIEPTSVENDARGLYARLHSIGANGYKGVEGYVSGGSGSNFGVMGAATGSGTNYGIYGTASGSSSSWAGYFNGDVHVTENVGIGTLNPTDELHVAGNAKVDGTLYANRVSSNSSLRLQTDEIKGMEITGLAVSLNQKVTGA